MDAAEIKTNLKLSKRKKQRTNIIDKKQFAEIFVIAAY
jgi:hypothetical protein